MSLFDRLKNKREDLQERSNDFTDKQQADNIRMLDNLFGTKGKAKKTAKEVKNRFFTDQPDSKTLSTKSTGDEKEFRRDAKRNVVDRETLKTRPGKSKKITVSALDKRDASIEKLDDVIIKPKKGDAARTAKRIKKLKRDVTEPKKGEVEGQRKIVKKIVNTKAQDYTDEINKQNKNRPEGQKRTYYKGRKAERTVYTDGSTRDQRVAKIKADIDKQSALKTQKKSFNKQLKADRLKQRTIQKKLRIDKAIAKSGESSIKFRDTARTIAKKFTPLTRTITTPAVTNKAGKIITPSKTKQALKPVVKKGIQFAQKAGPAGAIAAGSALALLNPSIRKTAKRVAKAALGATGLKAFAQKPQLVKRPPSKIGINLSPKA